MLMAYHVGCWGSEANGWTIQMPALDQPGRDAVLAGHNGCYSNSCGPAPALRDRA
jgi:hypothetical protein